MAYIECAKTSQPNSIDEAHKLVAMCCNVTVDWFYMIDTKTANKPKPRRIFHRNIFMYRKRARERAQREREGVKQQTLYAWLMQAIYHNFCADLFENEPLAPVA